MTSKEECLVNDIKNPLIINHDWEHIILKNLQDRNKKQTEPFISIYESNTKLWYEHARLQSLITNVKHEIATIQHETSEIRKSTTASASVDSSDKLILKLGEIQNELREIGIFDSSERNDLTEKVRELNKKVHDQGKLLIQQFEELKMAKSELAISHENTAKLSEEITKERAIFMITNKELLDTRKSNSSLEIDNTLLIERILVEKSKVAKEMNDMINNEESLRKG